MSHRAVTRALAGAATAALLLALAAPAAATNEEFFARGVRVSLAGIDLRQPAGAATALRAIRRAADRACDTASGADPDCVQRAVAGALRSLDQTALNVR